MLLGGKNCKRQITFGLFRPVNPKIYLFPPRFFIFPGSANKPLILGLQSAQPSGEQNNFQKGGWDGI